MSPDPSSARVFCVVPFTPTSHLPCHRQFKREKYLVRAILQIGSPWRRAFLCLTMVGTLHTAPKNLRIAEIPFSR